MQSSTVAIVAAEISQEHLAKLIGLPIDRASASYSIATPIAGDAPETMEFVTSYYAHLLCHVKRVNGMIALEAIGAEALALLERTFARDGGLAAVIAEARTGVRGGLRFVLDRMTDQFKREFQEKHVAFVLKTAFDQTDWKARVQFIREFFQYCPQALPAEGMADSPERFARNLELIVQTYVNGIDEIKQLLRSM